MPPKSKAPKSLPPVKADPSYDESVVVEILRRLSGGEGLAAICRDPGMPDESTVRAWALDDNPPGFAPRYARARELQAERWADEIVSVADNDEVDFNRSRLMVDARKWVASKLLPKRYGDRLDLTSGGEKMQAGVIVVPGCAASGEWAGAAADQQRKLEQEAADAGNRAGE